MQPCGVKMSEFIFDGFHFLELYEMTSSTGSEDGKGVGVRARRPRTFLKCETGVKISPVEFW